MDSNVNSGSLYVAQEKIYPREVKGTFQSLRNWAVIILLGIYYCLPWLRWDQHQAVLFDLPARKFYIFNLIFWPQDFYYLTWLLVIAALTLFLSTAVAGRLWCGYACPQTVWTEAFIWMERWTEGDRNRQMKLDKGPWNWNKIWRKSLKQFLWISFSLWTGFTFVGYFTPITQLGQNLLAFSLGPWETFWFIFYGFATYGNAGFMREQVCLYMCPYARFQSAMFDADTLIISYAEDRGEPRGSRKKSDDRTASGLGDCIDCKQCVHVCPTGIDIRKGLQYECIACGACIDACNQIMEKMDYPKNLIRYTTQNKIQITKRLFRPRTLIYSSIWILLVIGFITTISLKIPLDVDVIRDRNALYQRVDANTIENVYTLKVMNKDQVMHAYAISVDGIAGIQTKPANRQVEVAAGEVLNVPLRVKASLSAIERRSSKIGITLTATGNTAITKTEATRFLAPVEEHDE